MKLYGYKSAYSVSLKIRRGGQCHCCCCEADEIADRSCRKRNRKRARRWAKEDIKERLEL